MVSARRINEVLKTKPTILSNASSTAPQVPVVKFENVNFKYPGAEKNVLSNINLEIKQGQVVAFIGSTGSGKSTLVNLLPRIWDATEGLISIGGVNIRDMALEELNNIVGYIPQTAVIFTGTIRSNVDFGEAREPLTDEAIISALKTAQAWEFVSKLEGGIDAEVSQTGKNLSGGQKQRLSIARAIARKPEIFVFDDTFSALDFKTDRKLRQALKKETQGATTLIVAQRIGTIKEANQIFVLDKGTITARGTHHELMEKCPIYREMALSQLSEEELL
jgi:ATP-binding cassette subfamily B protein